MRLLGENFGMIMMFNIILTLSQEKIMTEMINKSDYIIDCLWKLVDNQKMLVPHKQAPLISLIRSFEMIIIILISLN